MKEYCGRSFLSKDLQGLQLVLGFEADSSRNAVCFAFKEYDVIFFHGDLSSLSWCVMLVLQVNDEMTDQKDECYPKDADAKSILLYPKPERVCEHCLKDDERNCR